MGAAQTTVTKSQFLSDQAISRVMSAVISDKMSQQLTSTIAITNSSNVTIVNADIIQSLIAASQALSNLHVTTEMAQDIASKASAAAGGQSSGQLVGLSTNVAQQQIVQLFSDTLTMQNVISTTKNMVCDSTIAIAGSSSVLLVNVTVQQRMQAASNNTSAMLAGSIITNNLTELTESKDVSKTSGFFDNLTNVVSSVMTGSTLMMIAIVAAVVGVIGLIMWGITRPTFSASAAAIGGVVAQVK